MQNFIDSLYIIGTLVGSYAQAEYIPVEKRTDNGLIKEVDKTSGEFSFRKPKMLKYLQVFTEIPKEGETTKKELHSIKVDEEQYIFLKDLEQQRLLIPVTTYAIKTDEGVNQGYTIPSKAAIIKFSELIGSNGSQPVKPSGVSIPTALSK